MVNFFNLRIVGHIFKRLAGAAGSVAGICIVATCVMTTYGVAMRYGFNKPPIFVEEFAGYLLLVTVFLGMVYTFERGEHIRITILTQRLPKTVQMYLEAITLSLGLVLILLLTKWAWILWLYNFRVGVTSLTSLHVPLWIPVTALVVGLSLFAAQLVLAIGQRIIQLGTGTIPNCTQDDSTRR